MACHSQSAPGPGAGGAWPSANLAIYIPFSLPVDATVNGMSFNCTAGNSAGRNFDIGIYDSLGTANGPGTKLSSSGATLMAAGINTWAANQLLAGGTTYYAAMSANNTSLTVWRKATGLNDQRFLLGTLQEATAEPLNSTATAVQVTNAYVPVIVMTFANLP